MNFKITKILKLIQVSVLDCVRGLVMSYTLAFQ